MNRSDFGLTSNSWTEFKAFHEGKHQTEFKLEVVKSFLAGECRAKLLARQWSVLEEKIRTWVSHYRLHGLGGLRPKRSACSEQFKLQRLSHQAREQLSSRQVAALYDIQIPTRWWSGNAIFWKATCRRLRARNRATRG
jgi:transposase-like protein